MGTVHDIITEHGREAALRFDFERAEIEAAAAYMSDEDSRAGFLYSGWCQTALPHRKLADDQGWQVDSGKCCLIVEPGMTRGAAGLPVHVGVPYGSRARLILIYLQSEALRTQSPEVLLGKSLREWLANMGISIGGRNLAIVRDQTERISRCRLTFEIRQGNRLGLSQASIMETAIFLEAADEDDRQRSLFVQTARLSQAFFDGLRKHPVPIEQSAVAAISNNSMAIDAYVWLAYRLHALTRPTPLSWVAAKTQFGAGFAAPNNFKQRFLPNLKLALAVYPKARVEVGDEGLTLYPSPPPVAKQMPASRTSASKA